jgi:single-strand DNA-binding protein
MKGWIITMSGYQKLILVGNLGGDPEMRYTPSGQAVTNFRMAVNHNWTAQDGSAQESTCWFRISVWGKQAETCNQYLSKGRQVLVEGRMTFDPETGGPKLWDDQNGKTRASFEVNAFDVKFLGGSGGNGRSNGSSVADDVQELVEDEIPF